MSLDGVNGPDNSFSIIKGFSFYISYSLVKFSIFD